MIRISKLVPDDRENILQLVGERGVFNEKEIRVAMEVVDEALRSGNEEYQILCARRGSTPLLGYICFGPIPMTDNNYDLYWIVVKEECSRKGIGRELLLNMEEMLIANGARTVYVDTSSTQPYRAARRFYEKNGFSIVCVLNDFYRQGDDKIIYAKEL